MTFRSTVLATLTALTLVPVLASTASAQGNWHHGPGHIYPGGPGPVPVIGIGHTGPGSWGVGAPGTPVVPVDGGHGCGADQAQGLVGHNIAHVPVPQGARVIGPTTVVTFDYRLDRLNIAHNGANTITRVYCG